MDKKTRKAQVVLAALDHDRQSICFLLLKTNERRGRFWQNITGKIEDQETFKEGALRECIEETGLKLETIIDIVDLNLMHEFIDDRNRKVLERSFLIVMENRFAVTLDPQEHSEYRWMPLEELKEDVVKHRGNFEALSKASNLLRHWGIS